MKCFLLLLILFSGCAAEEVERIQFEDNWWTLDIYEDDSCFNATSEGKVELYTVESTYTLGTWTFEYPNIYHLEGYDGIDYTFHVSLSGDCWKIRNGLLSTEACPCPSF